MSTITLHCGDCLEYMKGMADNSVDAVITDPPYGISGGSGHLNRLRGKGNYDGFFDDNEEYIKNTVVAAIRESLRVSKCVIVTPGSKNFIHYPKPDSFGCFFMPASVGLQVFGNADSQPIFYYGKNPTKKNMGKPCSYQLTEQAQKTGHPCAKPIRAWGRIVENNTNEGMTILDPFMGSGTTGVACVRLGRNFIGCEISPEYFAIAEKRIKQAQDDMALLDYVA